MKLTYVFTSEEVARQFLTDNPGNSGLIGCGTVRQADDARWIVTYRVQHVGSAVPIASYAS